MGVTSRAQFRDQLVAAVGSDRGTDAANRLCEACVDIFDVTGAVARDVIDRRLRLAPATSAAHGSSPSPSTPASHR